MSVVSFDGTFSFKQDSLARLGDRGRQTGSMSEADRAAFNKSPFMQQVGKIEELTWHKVSERDKRRAKTDPSFKPSDGDFEAAKAFKFDKVMNYYMTLGVGEFATQEEVKKAYKKLSLVYHPDKTSALSDEKKEEYAAIFMELKNAYQTLADNATRRQYDRERDKDIAANEIAGWKVKSRSQFDAREMMRKLMEEAEKKGPSKKVEVKTACRLEKFFYGGHKAIKRSRRVKDRGKEGAFYDSDKLFRIDVPPGTAEPFIASFRQQGDQHQDAFADTLCFQVASKPHETVERSEKDQRNLRVKKQVPLSPDIQAQPYLVARTSSIRGRHIILWGANPFFHSSPGAAELHVEIVGEGVGEGGSLSFVAHTMSAADAAAATAEEGSKKVPRAVNADAKQAPVAEQLVTVSVRHLTTEAEIYVKVSTSATVAQVRQQLLDMLQLKRGSLLKLLKPIGEGKFTPFPDREVVGDKRSFACGGTEWHAVPVPPEQALRFLKAVVAIVEAPSFGAELQRIAEIRNPSARMLALSGLGPQELLPEYGRKPEQQVLKGFIVEALTKTAGMPQADYLAKQLAGFQEAAQRALQGQTVPATALQPQAAVPSAPPASTALPAGVDPERAFLEKFRLGPASGFREQQGGSAKEVPPSMRRRVERRAKKVPVCQAKLVPMGKPVTLFTKPTCSIAFYSGVSVASAQTPPGSLSPGPLFAVCLSSQACSRSSAFRDWELLKSRLLLLLETTCFRLLRVARGILPRPLAAAAPPGSGGAAAEAPPMPWKRLADQAYKRGDYWSAMSLYTGFLESLPEGAGPEELAKALSNRAACLASVRDYQESLVDARRATELTPQWSKAWSRVGFAAAALGGAESLTEAVDAYTRAIELETTGASVDALFAVVRRQGGDSDAAHEGKEKGNVAVRRSEFGLAVALYTGSLARLRVQPGGDQEDPDAFLRSVLLCNRSSAFARLREWKRAVADAQAAVEAKKDFSKAHCRLGVALLGNRQCEQAYGSFAKCLMMEEDYPAARKGRNECLSEILRWRSARCEARASRRFADARRPRGSSRVFAVSDVHFDHKDNENWAHSIDDSRFQEDVLIVAGDLADTRGGVVRGLRTLRAKFRRVFYTVGHHEMWVSLGEVDKYSDSIAKLQGIFEACDELDVDFCPAAICEDAYVVPLHSWYTADFDTKDPFPNPASEVDKHCRWPIDADDQVWKYMLKLNEPFLGLPYHGTVITFSHFLPRQGLPFARDSFGAAKTVGCERIDDQVRAVKSKLHVFGHSHIRYTGVHDGLKYVQHPLGMRQDRPYQEEQAPLMMVYNGTSTCASLWDVSADEPFTPYW